MVMVKKLVNRNQKHCRNQSGIVYCGTQCRKKTYCGKLAIRPDHLHCWISNKFYMWVDFQEVVLFLKNQFQRG